MRTQEKKDKKQDQDIRQFLSVFESAGQGVPTWFESTQKHALTHFQDLGFPRLSDEPWKYTNVDPIKNKKFRTVADGQIPKLSIERIEKSKPCPLNWHRLVFVNGVYSKAFSMVSKVPSTCKVIPLKQAMQSDHDLVKPYLAKGVRSGENGFSALNTAFLQDGAFVWVPEDEIDLWIMNVLPFWFFHFKPALVCRKSPVQHKLGLLFFA